MWVCVSLEGYKQNVKSHLREVGIRDSKCFAYVHFVIFL